MKEQKKVNPLATESEGKLIAKFAIPAIISMLVDNKPGVLAAIASVFGVHKVSIARVIQKTKENDAAELVIVTEAVKEKHLEDALAHLVDMDTTREIGTVIREY